MGERGAAGLLQVPGGGGVSRASGPVVAGGQTAGTHYAFGESEGLNGAEGGLVRKGGLAR